MADLTQERAAIETRLLQLADLNDRWTDQHETEWRSLLRRLDALDARKSVDRLMAAGHVRMRDGIPSAMQPRRRDAATLTNAQDAALRALDAIVGEMSARSADRVDALVRDGDDAARWIAAHATPDYVSAFGKAARPVHVVPNASRGPPVFPVRHSFGFRSPGIPYWWRWWWRVGLYATV